jgi:hypothetical protein
MWTSFYDDFISYSRPLLATNTEGTITTLFKLLGWAFAEAGDKCIPFAHVCEALGVAFNLEQSPFGSASICNTMSRVTELCADLETVLKEGRLNSQDAQRLRGRMQFADAQLFGRTGKRCLKTLGSFAEGQKFILDGKDKLFLRLFANLLIQNIPRELRALDGHNAVIFTDACYERGKSEWPCGIGGVLFFMGQVSFFSVEVLALARTALGEQRKKQIIFEAETLAAVVAFRLWAPSLSNRTEMYSFC